jgi:undecaprenyl-diphosphatase
MRPRPFTLFDQAIWSKSNIPGFPSGHTLSIIVCFGFLIYLSLPKIKSYLGKVLAVLIALFVVVFIGFSRLYLGDHYLTDVIAGYAVGVAWFGLTCTFVELLFQRSRKLKEKSYGN